MQQVAETETMVNDIIKVYVVYLYSTNHNSIQQHQCAPKRKSRQLLITLARVPV
jgi:hypothetical protein